jgi:hypothetical protein
MTCGRVIALAGAPPSVSLSSHVHPSSASLVKLCSGTNLEHRKPVHCLEPPGGDCFHRVHSPSEAPHTPSLTGASGHTPTFSNVPPRSPTLSVARARPGTREQSGRRLPVPGPPPAVPASSRAAHCPPSTMQRHRLPAPLAPVTPQAPALALRRELAPRRERPSVARPGRLLGPDMSVARVPDRRRSTPHQGDQPHDPEHEPHHHKECPAASYSPTPSRVQYHQRCQA